MSAERCVNPACHPLDTRRRIRIGMRQEEIIIPWLFRLKNSTIVPTTEYYIVELFDYETDKYRVAIFLIYDSVQRIAVFFFLPNGVKRVSIEYHIRCLATTDPDFRLASSSGWSITSHNPNLSHVYYRQIALRSDRNNNTVHSLFCLFVYYFCFYSTPCPVLWPRKTIEIFDLYLWSVRTPHVYPLQ